MPTSDDTEYDLARLRQTFDEHAEAYDRWRPGYPEQLFADVISLSGIQDSGEIIEIGCGTGQATESFLKRGYRVTAVELGENLAEFCRMKLAGFPKFKVITGAFEDQQSLENKFDLLVSATAFHWVDASLRYEKAWSCLRPGGAIALFWNEHVEGVKHEPFFDAVQEVYTEVAPQLNLRYKGLIRPDKLLELKDYGQEISDSGLFDSLLTRTYLQDITYDTAGYIGMLGTFSDVIDLEERTRNKLLGSIAKLIDSKFGGRVVKTYMTVLHVAKRQA